MEKIPKKIPLIKISHMGMYFGSRYIFSDVSFDFFPGERTLLVGPSGSGKSTFLSIVSGTSLPSEGTICFMRENPIDTRDPGFISFSQKHIGFCYTNGIFFEKNTVEDNILFPALFGGYRYRQVFLETLIAIFEIRDLWGHAIFSLSSGERERVNLVRMFLYEPTILFLDEPFSHLDARLSLIGRDFLTSYCGSHKVTLFLATHEPKLFPEFHQKIVFSSDNHPQHIQ